MARNLGTVAVGLAGGAAKGLGNLGALKALEERGIRPAYIAGTSAGALVGGLYAAGKSVAELEELLSGLTQGEVTKLIDLTWARGSIVAGRNVEDFIRDLVGDVLIEDLPTPFTATAVDITTGAGYHLNEGPLVDAIRASISVPGVFEPVAANGGYLVDGGVRMNMPLEVLHHYRPDTLIGVNIRPRTAATYDWKLTRIDRDPGDDTPLWERLTSRLLKQRSQSNGEELTATGRSVSPKRKGENTAPGTAYLFSRVFELVMYEASQAEVERAAPDLVVDVDMEEIEVWEFWRGLEAVELGYRQTGEALDRFLAKHGPTDWWRTRARRLARRV